MNLARRCRAPMVLACWLGAGCGGPDPAPPAASPPVSFANGPPSAAAADVKNPAPPPATEPTRSRGPVIDYGPPSAAAADAARPGGR